MKENIEYLGPNFSSFYVMQWQINHHRLVIHMGPMGGMFMKIIHEEQDVLVWPSTNQKQIMLMELNYLAHEILNNNVENIIPIKPNKAFSPAMWGDNLELPENRPLLLKAMVDWVNKTFAGRLDPFENNYKYIPDFDVEEFVLNWNKTQDELLKFWQNKTWDGKDKNNQRKLKKVEEQEPEEQWDESMEKVEGEEEFLKQFGDD